MKANKQGISLIVLVITIVVVIILAAAVILSLGNNNPIDSARIANLAQTKDGIYSAVYSYTSATQAKTQAYYTDEQIILGTGTANTELGLTAPTGIVTSSTASTGTFADDKTKDVYELDSTTKFSAAIGEALPSAPFSGAKWYIDADGQIYLGVDAWTDLPSYLGKGSDEDATKDNVKADSTLLKTIVVVSAAE